jgi:hypothetical protein
MENCGLRNGFSFSSGVSSTIVFETLVEKGSPRADMLDLEFSEHLQTTTNVLSNLYHTSAKITMPGGKETMFLQHATAWEEWQPNLTRCRTVSRLIFLTQPNCEVRARPRPQRKTVLVGQRKNLFREQIVRVGMSSLVLVLILYVAYKSVGKAREVSRRQHLHSFHSLNILFID